LAAWIWPNVPLVVLLINVFCPSNALSGGAFSPANLALRIKPYRRHVAIRHQRVNGGRGVADLRHGCHHLPLRQFVDRVDVIQAFIPQLSGRLTPGSPFGRSPNTK